ncbi:MAG: T9SS type A sorting domain-containing protein [Bacteroidetes bacterium]|nr:T9SS type A sorting domain-containing protein [Bacteroidota bacterium]
MNKWLCTLLCISLCFSDTILRAQRTGIYDTTISFMGSNRALSIYVPPSYNPAIKYRLLIGLHGLGDTCYNYRNALITTVGWANGFGNTIFVFPEAANRNADYFQPAGGEDIIPNSRDFMMAQYHIDSQNVVLQGFSLGGRAALRYGLDHPTDFKGLLLNTPAVQGVKEAVNGHAQSYGFNYANAPQIPIFITLGDQDLTYQSPLDSTYEQLVLHDGPVRFTVVAGMGHQVPSLALNQTAFPFFSFPAHAGTDAEAVQVYPALWVCNSSHAAPSLLLRNSGSDTLRQIRYQYTLGSSTNYQSWSGTLAPFQHAIVPLNVNNATPADNIISVQIDSLNNNLADTVLGNNSLTGSFYLPAATLSSLSEGFEGTDFPPPGWTLQQSGDFYTAWEQDNSIALTGSNSATAFNTILIFDNLGRSDALITPPVNVSALAAPVLNFDVSFTYDRYTPPYFTANVDFADTLEVLASTDCGAHFSSIYRKGGAELATYANPVINPLNLNDLFPMPADSNWRMESIDLNALKTAGTPAIFKFNYISGLGGAINIDNVYIGTNTAVKNHPQSTLLIAPNPAHDLLQIQLSQAALEQLDLFDMSGRLLRSETASGKDTHHMQLPVSGLPAGLYLLHVTTSDGVTIRKISVLN